MRISKLFACGLMSFSWSFAIGAEPQESPRPTPITRPEMKRLIEDVKIRQPRIPLPELTAQNREKLGTQADIVELKKYYTDLQILEMILSMAGNNSINRWKEAIAVPQRKDEGGCSRVGRTDPAIPPDPAVASKLPSGCPFCQRGLYNSRKLREEYVR
jgi:hypothetical protein